MADLDVSQTPYQLALGSGGQSQDLVGNLMRMAYMKNAMNQNALFQQEFQAKQAIGPIAQKHVQPDGSMDWDGFAVDLASSPQAAFLAPQMLESLASQRKLNMEYVNQKLDNNLKQFQAIGAGVAPLVRKGQAITSDDAIGVAKTLFGQGVIDKDHFMNFMSGLGPMMNPDGSIKMTPDPNGGPAQSPLANYVQQIFAGSNQQATTLQANLPQFQSINTGPTTQILNRDPVTGAVTQPPSGIGAVGMGMAPAESNKIEEYNDPVTGQPKMARNYQMSGAVPGVGPIVGGGGAVQGGGIAGQTPQVAQPSGPVQSQPQPQSFPQSGGAVGLDPTTAEFLKGRGSYMVDYANGVDEAAHTAGTSLQTYNAMIDALGKARTGGGAGIRTEMAKYAQGIQGLLPTDLQPKFDNLVKSIQGGDDKNALAYAQEFEKYASIAAMQSLVSAQGSHYRPAAVEYTTIFKNFPRLDTDPKASRDMIQLTRSFLEQNLAEQKYMHKFISQLGSGFNNPETGEPYKITDWPSIWSSILSKSGRLGMEQKYYSNLGGKNWSAVQNAASGNQQ